jgi:hypothetical protein
MDSTMIQQEQQRDIETIQTINQLDTQMNELYQNLETLSVQNSPDINKQNQIIKQLEQLNSTKQNLYKTLSSSYASIQSDVAESRDALVNEVAVGGVIKNELTNAKQNLSVLQQERYNKLRMAEINDYYSDKYSTQTNVMKTVVYFCIPILILGILIKKNILPAKIGLGIIAVLAGICIFMVIMQTIDIMRRSNMVFDEYDFPFDPETADTSGSGNGADQPEPVSYTLSCAGEACCPSGNNFGTIWDPTNKQCVTPSYQDSQTEGFVGKKCLQSTFNKPNDNINIFKENKSVVKGYSLGQEDDYAKF